MKVDERQKQWYSNRDAWARDAVRGSRKTGIWPKYIPPFERGRFGLVGAPDDMLLVRRSPSADDPERRYDVVNRSGVLQAQIVVAPNEVIGHVGVRHAYVVFTDDDDIKRIRRYSWVVIANRRSGS